ncbi:Conserved oligomeric Golgi complex subunit 2 [Dinochytrium kinnereticum]|nr:Conserved oligomeric Golgi complex subunit 2 [Dinochytrium kinnereticum]
MNRDAFTDESFGAEQFISNRLHIPIPSLKTDLATTLSVLKHELIELINRDYADFINLSTNLVGVDRMISDINQPLEKIKLTEVKDYLQTLIITLQSKLDLRAEIREKKTYLQLYLNINESVDKVESLLNIKKPDAPHQMLNMSDKTDGKLIERVAIEYNQLQFLVSRGLGTPYVENIEWRITRIKDTLIATLSQSLRDSFFAVALNPGDTVASALLAQFLRTYVLIDKTREAGMVFEESIVDPYLSKVFISQAGIDGSQIELLKEIYSKVLEFIRVECSKILDICSTTLRDSQYDFFTDAIFAKVVKTLTKRMSFIFNPGIPLLFHQNYQASMRFLADYERSSRSYKSLLSGGSRSDFASDIIRYKEVIAVMEENISQRKATSSGAIGVNAAVLAALNRCWQDDVFLRCIGYRFFKLTLQVFARYYIWINEFAFKKDNRHQVENSESDPSNSFYFENLRQATFDIQCVSKEAKEFYFSRILSVFPEIGKSEQFSVAYMEALGRLTDLIPKLISSMSDILVRQSVFVIDLKIGEILPKFRFASTVPESASDFVLSILGPARDILDNGRLLSSENIMDLKTTTANGILTRYAFLCTRLLQEAEDSEKYIRNRKRQKGGVSSELLASDKVRLQLKIDVECFRQELTAFGVDVSSLAALQDLVRVTDGPDAASENGTPTRWATGRWVMKDRFHRRHAKPLFKGLRFDDLIPDESEIVQEAIRRLPPREFQDRIFRYRRALNLSMAQTTLEKPEWTKPEEDLPYLRPLIDQVESEIASKQAFDNLTSIPESLKSRNRST